MTCYARHPLQVLRILEEGHLAGYELAECLRRHNCTWDEYYRQQRELMPKGPIAFASKTLALAFLTGAYDTCGLIGTLKGLEVVDLKTEEEMPHDTKFRLTDEQVNAIAVEMLEAPHEPTSFFSEYHNLSHSSVARIRNATHMRLTDENKKNLLKLKAGTWVPPEKPKPKTIKQTPRQDVYPNMKQLATKETQLAVPPKLEIREIIMILRQRMREEGIIKIAIPEVGDVLVTKQEIYKL